MSTKSKKAAKPARESKKDTGLANVSTEAQTDQEAIEAAEEAAALDAQDALEDAGVVKPAAPAAEAKAKRSGGGKRRGFADTALFTPTEHLIKDGLGANKKGQVLKVRERFIALSDERGGGVTAQELADALVANGEYTCKPPAVEPTRRWLSMWAQTGYATVINPQ